MKSKLIFRILGAIASSMIILSVFIPFVNVSGYSTSLWESFGSTNSLYLPIMIIVFGAIGVIFFALNIKTEFAYMSTGAITFFLVMQTIDILNQGVFDTLSFGYYFLGVGAILTGLMAFLVNLKTKKVEEKVETKEDVQETSVLDQIDKLYSEQVVVQNQISPIQPIQNNIEPLPIQPMQNTIPVEPVVQNIEPVNSIVQPQEIEPVVEQNLQPVQPVISEPVNPVVQEFPVTEQPIQVEEPQIANPVLQEFSVQQQPSQPIQPQVINPVINEFNNQSMQPQTIVEPQPLVQPQVVEPIPQPVQVEEPQVVNPVLQEFTNPGLNNQQNPNELDIFGQ